MFKPGIYIDPDTKDIYENLGQLLQRYQPKSKFANVELLREQRDKLLSSAIKASKLLMGMERGFDKLLFTFLPR